MPGALLQVEGLINCAIQIQHEMDAETSLILKDLEALPARAGHIKMNQPAASRGLMRRL